MPNIALGLIDLDVDAPPDMTGEEAIVRGRGSSLGVACLLGSRNRVIFIAAATWRVTGVSAVAAAGEDLWNVTVRLSRE